MLIFIVFGISYLFVYYIDVDDKNDVYCKRDWKFNDIIDIWCYIYFKYFNICLNINRMLLIIRFCVS